MNVADIKIRVKRQFGDESLVQITDDDVVRWINDAQRDIVIQNEGVLETIDQQDLQDGTDEYTLPADLLVLRAIRIRYTADEPFYHIKGMSLSDFDQLVLGWDGSAHSGRPEFFTTYDGKICLFPKPNQFMTDGIKILYSQQPTTVTSDATPLSLPVAYHNAIVKYCLAQAYEMDEDLETSTLKMQQFQTEVNTNVNRETRGPTETYPVITVLEDDLWM